MPLMKKKQCCLRNILATSHTKSDTPSQRNELYFINNKNYCHAHSCMMQSGNHREFLNDFYSKKVVTKDDKEAIFHQIIPDTMGYDSTLENVVSLNQ